MFSPGEDGAGPSAGGEASAGDVVDPDAAAADTVAQAIAPVVPPLVASQPGAPASADGDVPAAVAHGAAPDLGDRSLVPPFLSWGARAAATGSPAMEGGSEAIGLATAHTEAPAAGEQYTPESSHGLGTGTAGPGSASVAATGPSLQHDGDEARLDDGPAAASPRRSLDVAAEDGAASSAWRFSDRAARRVAESHTQEVLGGGTAVPTPGGPTPVDARHLASVPDGSGPPLPPAAGESVLHELVSSLRMQWKDGIGEARLQLRPDALGAVSVSLKVEAGVVTAVVRAENAQVQEWVVQHQQTLREQLEGAGLRLDELVVTQDDGRERDGHAQESADQRHRRRRDAVEAGASTFERLL